MDRWMVMGVDSADLINVGNRKRYEGSPTGLHVPIIYGVSPPPFALAMSTAGSVSSPSPRRNVRKGQRPPVGSESTFVAYSEY